MYNHDIESEDMSLAMLHYPSGIEGVIVCTTTFPDSLPASIEIHGTKGGAVYRDGEIAFWKAGGDVEAPACPACATEDMVQTLRKALAEYLGACGERLFFKVPDDRAGEDSDLVGVLTAGAGGSEDAFRKAVKKISDPIRLHRVLDLANRVLADRVRTLRDRMGPNVTARVVSSIDKEVTFLLAQKRSLATKYDIAREFREALRGE